MKAIDLHERAFENETIEDAKLIFRGQGVLMNNCTMQRCELSFLDEAATTVQFLSALYKANGQGALLVEELFDAIRAGNVGDIRALQ